MLYGQDSISQPLFLSLERKLGQQAFDTWFRPLKVTKSATERVLQISAPNAVVRDWIIAHYADVLKDSLGEHQLGQYRIEWSLAMSESRDRLERDPPGIESRDDVRVASSTIPDGETRLFVETTPSALNERYTFSSFVAASCNRFAHAAAKAVADAPGKTYNPLYLYGGVGLGKTHLIQAIGHSIRIVRPDLQVAYLSLERFMNELINAIRYGYDKTRIFRERYRSIDVLLIDDIQFIAGKERTQEEFFHTFNALYDGQKQIVITSDCPPREIPTLEERLHSRFEWGLIADIEPPDLETKVAILKRKADLDGVTLPDDVAFFIASKVKSNIRELEGSLVRLIAISSLRGLPISKMLAQDAIRNIAEDSQPAGITIEQIQRTVAAHYKLRADDLKSKNNSRQIAVPRQVAMYLCKRLTKHSFPEIGREFGGKHHTTVIHSVEKIEALVSKDQNFHRVVSDLMDNLCK